MKMVLPNKHVNVFHICNSFIWTLYVCKTHFHNPYVEGKQPFNDVNITFWDTLSYKSHQIKFLGNIFVIKLPK